MSQSSMTEKRTVITSSSSSSGGGMGQYDGIDDIPYKSSLGTRSNIINRSSMTPLRHSTGGSGGTSIVRTVEYGYGSSSGGMGPGGYANVSNTGVSSVKNSREREKKDLQDLNERFASYIEKVRFLEAQNRKLGNELEELRSKWGKETSHIKQMYEAELAEARRLIDDLSKDKAALEIKISSTQEQFGDLQRQLDESKKYRQIDRDQINKQNQQLADYESELNMLRRSIESLETERSRDKATINRLQQEIDKLRIDLNNETLAHLDAENRRQTLEEEMEFMKKVHEQELKELASLAYRDTTAENREYWKSELSQAIRDIQQEYDSKVDQIRGDMEGFYNLKIQEFRTGATKQNMEVTHVKEENKKLIKQMSDLRGKLADMEARNAQMEKQYHEMLRELETKDSDHMMETSQLREEISKLRTEMEAILTELQTLMDAKLSLELEICAYRKLLEGEENRPHSPHETVAEKEKEPVADKPIQGKHVPTVSSQPESIYTGARTEQGSFTAMSADRISPKEDVNSEQALEKIDTEKDNQPLHDKSGDIFDEDGNEPSVPASEDSIEHVVTVKTEVMKIESLAKDERDGSLTPSDTEENVEDSKRDSTPTFGDKDDHLKDINHDSSHVDEAAVVEETFHVTSTSKQEATPAAINADNVESIMDNTDAPETKSAAAPEQEEIKDVGGNENQNSQQYAHETIIEKEHKGETETVSKAETVDNDEKKIEDADLKFQSEYEENQTNTQSSDKTDSKSENRSEHDTQSEKITEQNETSVETKIEDTLDKNLKYDDLSDKREMSSKPKDETDEKSNSLESPNENKLLTDSHLPNDAEELGHACDEKNKSTDSSIEVKPSPVNETFEPTTMTKSDLAIQRGIENADKGPAETKLPGENTDSSNNEVIKSGENTESVNADLKSQTESDMQQKSVINESPNKAENDIQSDEKLTEPIDNYIDNKTPHDSTDAKAEQVLDLIQAEPNDTPRASDVDHTSEPDSKKLVSPGVSKKDLHEDSDNGKAVPPVSGSDSKLENIPGNETASLTNNEEIKTESNLKSEYKESDSQSQAKDVPDAKIESAPETQSTETVLDKLEQKDVTSLSAGESKGESNTLKMSTSVTDNTISGNEIQASDKKVLVDNVTDKQLTNEKDTEKSISGTEKDSNALPITDQQDQSTKMTDSIYSLGEPKVDTTTKVSEDAPTVEIERNNIEPSSEPEPSPIKADLTVADDTSIKQDTSKTNESNIIDHDSKSLTLESTKVTENINTSSTHSMKSDQFGMEITEKTEDKVLETVVKSEVIEKSSLEDSITVETSPTKELPDALPSADTNDTNKDRTGSESVAGASSDTADTSTTGDEIPAKSQDPLIVTQENIEHIQETKEASTPSNTDDVQHAVPTKNDTSSIEPVKTEQTEANTNDKDIVNEHVPAPTAKHDAIEHSANIVETKQDLTNVTKTVVEESHDSQTKSSIKVETHDTLTDSKTLTNGVTDEAHHETQKVSEFSAAHTEQTKVNKTVHVQQREVISNGVHETTAENNDQQNETNVEKTGTILAHDKSKELDTKDGVMASEETDKLLINGEDSQVSMKMMRGEVSAKTTYQRTSTGPVAISEVSPEGKFIMLENTSSGPNRRDVNLDGWKLRRSVDGKRDYTYNFRNFTLKSGKKVKILARGSASEAGLNDLVFREEDNWGVGSQVTTNIINDKDEEKASHIQKTLYN